MVLGGARVIKRADLEASIYDLNGISRTLSDVMLSKTSGSDRKG